MLVQSDFSGIAGLFKAKYAAFIEPLPDLAVGLSISVPSEAFRTMGTLLAGLAGLYAAELVRRARAERQAAAPAT